MNAFQCLYFIPLFRFCARINDDSDEGCMSEFYAEHVRSTPSRWVDDPAPTQVPTGAPPTEQSILFFLSCLVAIQTSSTFKIYNSDEPQHSTQDTFSFETQKRARTRKESFKLIYPLRGTTRHLYHNNLQRLPSGVMIPTQRNPPHHISSGAHRERMKTVVPPSKGVEFNGFNPLVVVSRWSAVRQVACSRLGEHYLWLQWWSWNALEWRKSTAASKYIGLDLVRAYNFHVIIAPLTAKLWGYISSRSFLIEIVGQSGRDLHSRLSRPKGQPLGIWIYTSLSSYTCFRNITSAFLLGYGNATPKNQAGSGRGPSLGSFKS